MLKNSQYRYSKNNLLEFPQKYSLTEFQGKKFLIDYKNERIRILDNIKPQTLDENLDVSIKNLKMIKELKEISQFETENLLTFFLQQLRKSKINKKLESIFFRLIKEFEDKKKIFTIYDSNCKESSKTYDNLTNYLLLSIICIHYYERSKNLKFLNTVLKLNDTIISQFNNITNNTNLSLLHYSIISELENINNLIQKKGLE